MCLREKTVGPFGEDANACLYSLPHVGLLMRAAREEETKELGNSVVSEGGKQNATKGS